MKLSEAIRTGLTFRGESHDGPFSRIANTEELRSDVWGAACEAVHSPVAKRNWNRADEEGYASDTEHLRFIQEKYFRVYFNMPASCPGATPGYYSNAGGRFTGKVSRGVNEVALEREQQKPMPAITTACPGITNLAELIEHMFYVHNWSREECAQAVEWYEQQSPVTLVQNFEHYQDLSVQKSVAQRLTIAARQREIQRHSRQRVYSIN